MSELKYFVLLRDLD